MAKKSVAKKGKKAVSKVRHDAAWMRKIGAMGGRTTARRMTRKKGSNYFSELAKRSHPKNNPEVKRVYAGGRPRNDESVAKS